MDPENGGPEKRMSATSGGSVSEGSDAGESSRSTMSVSDSPPTSIQSKHMENGVTRITLSSEDNSSDKNNDVENNQMNLTMDEREKNEGVDNLGFESDDRLKASEIDFKSINGSEKKGKSLEAVNLELVHMVPYNNGTNGSNYGIPVSGIPGIPVKKDAEQVDLSTPYDEYFVPVNEHRKYMRYVFPLLLTSKLKFLLCPLKSLMSSQT